MFPSRKKHFPSSSVSLQSQQRKQYTCQSLSSAFRRYLSLMSSLQPPHFEQKQLSAPVAEKRISSNQCSRWVPLQIHPVCTMLSSGQYIEIKRRGLKSFQQEHSENQKEEKEKKNDCPPHFLFLVSFNYRIPK